MQMYFKVLWSMMYTVAGSFQPSYEMMLTFYALYKQAIYGPCTSSRPYVWDVVGRAKW